MSIVVQYRTAARTFRVEQIGQASEEPEPPRVLVAYLRSILIEIPRSRPVLNPRRPSGKSGGKGEDGSAHAELVHCFQANFGRPWQILRGRKPSDLCTQTGFPYGGGEDVVVHIDTRMTLRDE